MADCPRDPTVFAYDDTVISFPETAARTGQGRAAVEAWLDAQAGPDVEAGTSLPLAIQQSGRTVKDPSVGVTHPPAASAYGNQSARHAAKDLEPYAVLPIRHHDSREGNARRRFQWRDERRNKATRLFFLLLLISFSTWIAQFVLVFRAHKTQRDAVALHVAIDACWFELGFGAIGSLVGALVNVETFAALVGLCSLTQLCTGAWIFSRLRSIESTGLGCAAEEPAPECQVGIGYMNKIAALRMVPFVIWCVQLGVLIRRRHSR